MSNTNTFSKYLRNTTTCGRRLRCFLATIPKAELYCKKQKKNLVGEPRGLPSVLSIHNFSNCRSAVVSDTSALQWKIVFSLIRILQKALRLLILVCTAWEFSFKVFTLFLKFSIFVSKIVKQSPQTSVLASHFSYMEKVERNVQRNSLGFNKSDHP